jgi:hypothetical protein
MEEKLPKKKGRRKKVRICEDCGAPMNANSILCGGNSLDVCEAGCWHCLDCGDIHPARFNQCPVALLYEFKPTDKTAR